jgi:hypothetical protein
MRLIPPSEERKRPSTSMASPPKDLTGTEPDAGLPYSEGIPITKLREEAARWKCTVEEAWRRLGEANRRRLIDLRRSQK